MLEIILIKCATTEDCQWTDCDLNLVEIANMIAY